MARIFRQQYTKATPDGGKVKGQSRKWYIEYKDAQGIRRRVPWFTDKQATQQFASDLERESARATRRVMALSPAVNCKS